MHRTARGMILVAMVLATSAASAQTATPGDHGCSQPGNLAQSGGVICPQNVDPAIKAPTPRTGDKPVIRPPEGQGGNPNVQPK